MTLNLALVISGDAKGAKKAATETREALKSVTGAAERANAASRSSSNTVVSGVGQTAKLTSFQLTNLQFQLQDIAVGVASGQGFGTILLQQGSQIVQMFDSGTGVRGALKAVGSGIRAFLTSPLNIALLGFAATAAAAQFLFKTIFTGGKDAADVLEQHEKIAKRIRDIWPDAARGSQKYFAGLETLARANVNDLQQLVDNEREDLNRKLGPRGVISLFSGIDFGPFRSLFDDFSAGIGDAGQSVTSLRQEIEKLARGDTANAELQGLARQLLDLTDDAYGAESSLREAQSAILAIGSAASQEALKVREFGNSMQDLSRISPPKLSDRERAGSALQDALKNAGGGIERIAATQAYEAALMRITDAEKQAADAKTAREKLSPSLKATSSALRERESVEALINSLRDEYDQLLLNDREREIQVALRSVNTAATNAERAEISALVGSTYDLATAQEVSADRINQMRLVASGVVSSFRQAREAGKSWSESLGAALDSLNSRLLDLATNQIFDLIFGSRSGGSGGFLGAIFSGATGAPLSIIPRADGGPVSAGRDYLVGENGAEIVRMGAAGTVMPNSGGGRSVAVGPISIDARGAQAGVAEQIAAIMPSVIAEAVRQATGGVQGEIQRLAETRPTTFSGIGG